MGATVPHVGMLMRTCALFGDTFNNKFTDEQHQNVNTGTKEALEGILPHTSENHTWKAESTFILLWG